METSLHTLAARIPPPQKIPYKDSFVYRYLEKTIHQALAQKLARYLSTLRAATILCYSGYFQEQATLQRTLDEIQEDIAFLSLAIHFNDRTPLHNSYLDAFYEEEFDAASAMESTQKRPMIPRRKIRAYIARLNGLESDPSTSAEASRTISKGYSGYVHAASPQIMDMYGGVPPRFHTAGMASTHLEELHRDDLWNYYYRGITSFAITAKAFEEEDLFKKLFDFAEEFSKDSGKGYELILRPNNST